jgi:hypothetical protein
MITFNDIENMHVMLRAATNRDGSGVEPGKCPTLVAYIDTVARTKQAWNGGHSSRYHARSMQNGNG